jgi:hypothetical protein
MIQHMAATASPKQLPGSLEGHSVVGVEAWGYGVSDITTVTD